MYFTTNTAFSGAIVIKEVFNRDRIESIILKLGDEYYIRVSSDSTTSIGTLGVAGALIQSIGGIFWHYYVGAAMGGETRFVLEPSLREVWPSIRDELEELFYLVYNFLRRLDPHDPVHAFEILMDCIARRTELVIRIIKFLNKKFGRKFIASYLFMSMK